MASLTTLGKVRNEMPRDHNVFHGSSRSIDPCPRIFYHHDIGHLGRYNQGCISWSISCRDFCRLLGSLVHIHCIPYLLDTLLLWTTLWKRKKYRSIVCVHMFFSLYPKPPERILGFTYCDVVLKNRFYNADWILLGFNFPANKTTNQKGT